MKGKTYLFLSIVFLAILYVLFFRINRENLNYNSKYNSIDAKTIKEKYKDVVVVIISTDCPSAKITMPQLIKNIKKFNKKKLKYIIVADELYNDSMDVQLDDFIKKYSFNEKIFLMDKKKYPENAGIFNIKKRYKDFMTDLCVLCANTPLGYTNYIIIKNGNYFSSKPYFDEKDI